ncbi:hypothetical protein [Kytococcus sp. Marseille-QA3725]
MNRNVLTFLALAITIIYGLGFAVLDDKSTYAVIGAGVVAIAWIAVSMLGRDDSA